jgi:LysR family transcriptional regulator, nod-box dependent transcriptional activator
MQLHRFDLNLLVALDMLLRERNVTRAAEKLYVSQPAMSASLNKLRAYFGDPLLVRVGREFELTARAVSLVEPVREALLKVQTALGTQPEFTPASAQREFSIIVTDAAIPGFLPAILRRVAREAPGIRCHIELVSQACLSKLEKGDVDLCLILDNLKLYEAQAYPPNLERTRLREVRWVCAVDRNNPAVGDTLTAEQYFSLPQVAGRPGGYGVSGEELLRRLLDVEVQVHLTVPSLLQLPLVVVGTPYIATLPERVASLMGSPAAIKTFPVPVPMPTQYEILVWHKRYQAEPAHAWLRNLIIELAHEC